MNDEDLLELKNSLIDTTTTLEGLEKDLKVIQEKINLLRKKQRRLIKNIDSIQCKKVIKQNVNILLDFD